MVSNMEIMNSGITCLLEKLGVVETEQFISTIIREKFDYTKWQQQRFDDMSSDEFQEASVAYAKENPFSKKISGYSFMGICMVLGIRFWKYVKADSQQIIAIR